MGAMRILRDMPRSVDGGTAGARPYTGHWSWTGLSDNDTLWDWLKLLVLPLSLAALPLWLQSHHRMSVTRRDIGRGSGGVRQVRATRLRAALGVDRVCR